MAFKNVTNTILVRERKKKMFLLFSSFLSSRARGVFSCFLDASFIFFIVVRRVKGTTLPFLFFAFCKDESASRSSVFIVFLLLFYLSFFFFFFFFFARSSVVVRGNIFFFVLEKKEWATTTTTTTTTVRIFFLLLVSGATSRVFFFFLFLDDRGVKEEEEQEKEQTIIVVTNKSVDFRGRRSGGDFRDQFDAFVDSAVPNSSLSTGGFER